MKKIVFLIMCLCSVYANSQEGVPFFVNYPASVYQAHNRNFDVVCDSCGNVYFANFEGILHYDYNRWVWRANLCATFLGNLVYPTPASKMLHFP